MTTLEPEQKDILEKLNEIALEANWGTVERVNGVPKAVAVIREAWACIRNLRAENDVIEKQFYELVDNTNNAIKDILQCWKDNCDMRGETDDSQGTELWVIKTKAKHYGVTLDEKNS